MDSVNKPQVVTNAPVLNSSSVYRENFSKERAKKEGLFICICSGALYHVTSQGDGWEDIYIHGADRAMFLTLLVNVNVLLVVACLLFNESF